MRKLTKISKIVRMNVQRIFHPRTSREQAEREALEILHAHICKHIDEQVSSMLVGNLGLSNCPTGLVDTGENFSKPVTYEDLMAMLDKLEPPEKPKEVDWQYRMCHRIRLDNSDLGLVRMDVV